MQTGKTFPVTKEKKHRKKNEGLPKGISTEAQLWDEIFKKEVLEMPFLLLPLIYEVHGKFFPKDTQITPFGTEYSVERVVTKDISSIRSDSTVWIDSMIFHFECEIGSHPKITKRVFEYDTQAALVYAKPNTKEIPYRLEFPYSTVLFLEPEANISEHLTCELNLPVYSLNRKISEKTTVMQIGYALPALKVQNYSLQELREKHLLILLPFTPIRFRPLLKRQKEMKTKGERLDINIAKLELTNFFHEIILILDEAVETRYICEIDRKDILSLLRKAMIRVFQEDNYLLEVVNHMTAPILEFDREKIVRLQKENGVLTSKNSTLASENSTLASENSTLASEKKALKSDLDILKSEYDSLLLEYEVLKSENAKKDITIQSMMTKRKSSKSRRHPFWNRKNSFKK